MKYSVEAFIHDYPIFFRECQGYEPRETDMRLARWVFGLMETAYGLGGREACASKGATGMEFFQRVAQKLMGKLFTKTPPSQSTMDKYATLMYEAYIDGYLDMLKENPGPDGIEPLRDH